ncbi:MAG: LamG domain-containing protein [Lentisphaerae bacterium]|jgi:hypothetical protein|nr:LamG domain-containing protein [Lentisphaerota bacterium]
MRHLPSLLLAMTLVCAPLLTLGQEHCDAEATAYLKQLSAASANYAPRSGRTAFFSRAQLKYGLERSDYLHRWGDRPLLQNTSFQDLGSFTVSDGVYSDIGFLNPLSYRTMTEVLKRFDIDGFAFFPGTKGRRDLYRHCGTPGATIAVLPEFTYSGFTPPGTTVDPAVLEPYLELAAEALASPQAYRINGKIVITTYPGPSKGNDLAFWAALKKALIERLGDHFIIMPYATLTHITKIGGKNAPYSKADIDAMRESLRQWLRVVDGYYHNSPAISNRRYDRDTDRNFTIPILHSVLTEPEFQGKYLAWGAKVGHMNCQLLGYSLDAFGTDMLRGTVSSALLAKADVINLVEWDEENENTCFRPTINTSFSTGRIIRYFVAQAKNAAPTMLPGDDPTVPNLIISSRRILSAGEALEIEIVNVPDGTAPAPEYTLDLRLCNLSGQTVHQFPPRQLATAELATVVFTVPTPDLLPHQVLIPQLTATAAGTTFTVSEGLQPIELRANWNWDYVWVKQPLRDLDRSASATLTVSPAAVDGAVAITVQAQSMSDLRSLEVLEGCDVIYSHSNQPDYRETTERVAIAAAFQASRQSPVRLTGAIRWHGAPSLRVRSSKNWPPEDIPEPSAWFYADESITHWPIIRYATLSREDAARAEIEVDLPGVAQGRLKVADLQRLGSYGFAGPHGFNLVFRLYASQVTMPPPLNQKEASFTILARPTRANAVFYVQTVNQIYQTYRSAAVSLFRPTGATESFHVFSVAENAARAITADRGLLMPLAYDFSPQRGSVFFTPASQELLGVLGGFTPQATGVAAGESIYGNPMDTFIARKGSENYPDLAPKHRQDEQGRHVLDFAGASYISVPLGAVPAYAGYEVEIDVMPTEFTAHQTLFGNDSAGFVLGLRNDRPVASIYCNQVLAMLTVTGPPLTAGQWSRITVRFDQQTLSIAVNGVVGETIPASGYQRYPRAYTVGAHYRFGNFFHGSIGRLIITPK